MVLTSMTLHMILDQESPSLSILLSRCANNWLEVTIIFSRTNLDQRGTERTSYRWSRVVVVDNADSDVFQQVPVSRWQ
jgi:hypothetical protein